MRPLERDAADTTTEHVILSHDNGHITYSEPSEARSPFWTSGRTVALPLDGEGIIGDHEMKRAFEQIVSAIHMDEEEAVPHVPKDLSQVPDLDSPQSTSSRFSFRTPRSSPGYGLGIGMSSISPSRRRVSPNLDPPMINSPVPLSTKSFLDDDWLRDRVKHDSKMAQVAGGLVRSSSTPPAVPEGNSGQHYLFGPTLTGQGLVGGYGGMASGMVFASNIPPRDYICKLCNVPGHWLKDCHLYEPRNGMNGVIRCHSRTPSISGMRSQNPPGNYICRLCGVAGHWIEACSKFQPKTGKAEGLFKGTVPPRNYVCNLCQQPGHWIQQCAQFTPIPGNHKRSLSSERGRFF